MPPFEIYTNTWCEVAATIQSVLSYIQPDKYEARGVLINGVEKALRRLGWCLPVMQNKTEEILNPITQQNFLRALGPAF
jgi:hypothetical protein